MEDYDVTRRVYCMFESVRQLVTHFLMNRLTCIFSRNTIIKARNAVSYAQTGNGVGTQLSIHPPCHLEKAFRTTKRRESEPQGL